MKRFSYLLFLSLLLVACSQQTQIHVTTTPANVGVEPQFNEAFLNANGAQLFFKEDQSVAYFEGMGNEFASFTETTHWLSDEIIEVTVDNGGSIIHRYFAINGEAISLLTEIADGELPPSLEQLEHMPLTHIIVQFPLAVGDVSNEWRITDLATTARTPYATFEQVLLFEKATDNEINRIYVVPGFGMVKNEFVLNIDDEEQRITSSLATISYQ